MFILTVAQALRKEGVPYAVVGGFAVALHGAVRGTLDVDIVLNLREKDFIAAERALNGIGLECRLPVSAKEVFKFREEYIANRNLIAWSFQDPRNPINQVDVILTEDLKRLKTETLKISGGPIAIASLESLIRMKKKAGRAQDKEDVSALEKLAAERARKGKR